MKDIKNPGHDPVSYRRAWCRGLILLGGPRGTLQKKYGKGLAPPTVCVPAVALFLLGISWRQKFKSLSEVPTAALSSTLLFGKQHVRIAAKANPEQE